MPTFDMVFEGGGAKGMALAGAVSAIFDRGHSLGRLVGSSAGAITATHLAIGIPPEAILEGSTLRIASGAPIYTTFAQTPASSELTFEAGGVQLSALMHLAERGGLHRADGFVTWMQDCMETRGSGLGEATFAELHAHTGRHLSVVATDTTDRRMLVLNHRTSPDLPVVWAVRMSMSIPFYWTELTWEPRFGRYLDRDLTGHPVVDGGVASNFPLFLIAEPDDDEVIGWMGPVPRDQRNPVIGLYLDPMLSVPGAPVADSRPALHSRIGALLDTLMAARDEAIFEADNDEVIRLPVQGYGTTEFDMNEARVRALYYGAAAAARAWLVRHGH